MQPPYALLPATNYPMTVGGMCYAIVGQSGSNEMLTSCYAYLMEIRCVSIWQFGWLVKQLGMCGANYR